MKEKPRIDPPPPDLAGLTWRQIGRTDLASVAELAAACFAADAGLHFLVEPESIYEKIIEYRDY